MFSLLDFLFPKQCVGCRSVGSYFCKNCISTITQTELVCPFCERLSLGGAIHPICRRHFGLDGLWSLGIYQDPLRRAIQKLKYRFVKEVGQVLVEITIEYWARYGSSLLEQLKKDGGEGWVMVPVPLHKARERWRGFNQTALLAKLFSKRLNLSYSESLLRIKNTKPQMSLKSEDRKQNIRGAFTIKNPQLVKDKKVILLDDVWTTGSTLKECCYVLKRAGAQSVWALTIAR